MCFSFCFFKIYLNEDLLMPVFSQQILKSMFGEQFLKWAIDTQVQIQGLTHLLNSYKYCLKESFNVNTSKHAHISSPSFTT